MLKIQKLIRQNPDITYINYNISWIVFISQKMSLAASKRNEIVAKTKENFNHLTNYQILEENGCRLVQQFNNIIKIPCSIFSLFYPVPFGLLPHGHKMVAVTPSTMFSHSRIQVR